MFQGCYIAEPKKKRNITFVYTPNELGRYSLILLVWYLEF